MLRRSRTLDPEPDVCSATSPLVGVKFVISGAAPRNKKGTVPLVTDVVRVLCRAKAAKALRSVHDELPENGGAHGSQLCGMLRRNS